MIIVGAKGHAKEVLDILKRNDSIEKILFFDNYSKHTEELLYEKYKILKHLSEARESFEDDNRFILGLGGAQIRFNLSEKFKSIGGQLTSIISNKSSIGDFNVRLRAGINIMHYVSVSNDVIIGEGTLINSFVSVHHDCVIGKYCEISPGARILGRSQVGDYSTIGSNSVILPDIKVGENVKIGAGAVVTKDTDNNATYVGVPAVKIK